MPQNPEPRTRLGRLLRDHPEARDPLRRAIGALLVAILGTIVAVGALAIWHLRRRADRLRDRLETGGGCNLAPPDPRTDLEEDLPA